MGSSFPAALDVIFHCKEAGLIESKTRVTVICVVVGGETSLQSLVIIRIYSTLDGMP